MFDPKIISQDFPILSRSINGKKLVYLDNAATSQKPRAVIDVITHYYETSNANVHRGVHTLSDESTKLWEDSRKTIADFFGAQPDELILTRNTTEAINGIAYGWADSQLKPGDVIITTLMEHHADIVPWQEAATRTGAILEFIPLDENGRVDLKELQNLLQKHQDKVKLLALTFVSNALGTRVPLEKIVAMVTDFYPKTDSRPKIAVDGAQAAPHFSVHFDKLNIDFLAFSGHKMLGPMGVGGLLVRKKLLETQEMKPWFFGGGMIAEVHTDKTIYNEIISERFTAGTPDVASAVGLAAACSYLTTLGMQNVLEHDKKLVAYALAELSKIPELTIIGPKTAESARPKSESETGTKTKTATEPDFGTEPNSDLDRIGSVTFVYGGVHAHDVAQILDSEGIAVRSGHHCTMPLHEKFGWPASLRVSFQIYNTTEDIDELVHALAKVKQIFKK